MHSIRIFLIQVNKNGRDVAKCITYGNWDPVSPHWHAYHLENVCRKPLWSVDECAVLPDNHWSFYGVAWDNGKLLTQALLLNGARRLDTYDVVGSLAPCEEQSWHPKQMSFTATPWDQIKLWGKWKCSVDFRKWDGRAARLSEICTTRCSVKLWIICVFLVTMGII